MLTAHAIADLFPMLDGDDFESLKKDIDTNGVHVPIVLHDGRIVDGRNRYRACQELGKECPTTDWVGDEESLTAFVWSMNGERRHLSPSQKAMIAADMLPFLEAEAKERMKAGGGDKKSENARDKSGTEKIPDPIQGEAREAAAKLVGVNPRYVSDAKVLQRDNPELAEKVRKGELSMHPAMEQRRVENPKLRNPEMSRAKRARAEGNDSETTDRCWEIIESLYRATRRPSIVAPYSELKSLIAELHRVYAARVGQ
jgi:hypothetical protein